MNKIILDNNKPFYLDVNDKDIDIIIRENTNGKIIIVGESDYKLNLDLEVNSSLIVNSLNKDNNVQVSINLRDNSSIIYNHSTLGNNNSDNTFLVNHLENNTSSVINNNGINRNENNLLFKIDGVIKKELKNINCNQNSKIINFNKGNSKIIPNLIIDSNDIVANHSAYIGEIGEEELFYFKSRGINEEEIKKLIYKSVLLGKMELLEEEELFNKKLKEWW